eukprot:Gb_04671 [translate_table: standard]
MASALIVPYERHQPHNSMSRNSTMKKSQKVPAKRPYSYDVLPEYPHAVENMGESDGKKQNPLLGKSESFGGSGRFDSETASEDSCTLKRKSVNLNMAGQQIDALGAPIQVFAVSQMSRTERMQLRKKLKVELEQVKFTTQKIESKDLQITSSGSVPTISDGHISRLENSCPGGVPAKSSIGASAIQASGVPLKDCAIFGRQLSFASEGSQGNLRILGKEKRTPKVNQLYLNSEYVSGNDKMPSAEKQKSKGGLTGVKRGLYGRFESKDGKRQRVESVQSKKLVEQMKQCADILKRIMTHKFGWVFNEPVDPVKLNIPDYYKVITRPMDLGTVKTRLENERYSSPLEFAEDVRLTFSNAMKYNPPGNDYHVMAHALSTMFERKWKSVEDKLAGEEVYRKLTQGVQLLPMKKEQKNKIMDFESKPKTSNSNCDPISNVSVENKPKTEPCKRPMTFLEKQKLTKDLEQLPADMPEQIITFFRKHTGVSQHEDEIEVDIDAFNDETLWELQKIVINCLRNKGQGKTNSHLFAEPRDLKIENVGIGSQLHDSPKIIQKGGDPGDEYVDVGGHDMPASNFPSTDVDKDGAGASNKFSSSSSSSSDSGSSSSDSDSGSSSGSDSDADEAHSTEAPHKVEKVDSGIACEQRGSSDPETNGAVSVLDEENAHPKPAVTDADAHQEGESAPPERQVSPDKLLRAAMLRSRFADTILKAQEKTLNQADKGDPEKLRREREQLERWQREEKARIQAEAKAAEAASKRVEAEAAAEAKRKREMDREAARLALQNMEKTVEIDENSQILKDLEMLRYAPPEHIPSSGDETSPVHSLEGLGNFTLQGGNPLEQLGLFMKLDEEEEETTADCAAGNGDVEEGEID